MSSINWQDFIPFGQAIGWTIIHSLWQILLISLGLRLILLLVPQKHATARYNILLFGLITMTIWVGCSFSAEWTKQQIAATSVAPVRNIEHADKTIATLSSASPEGVASATKTPLKIRHSLPLQLETFGTKLIPYLPLLAISWFIGALLFSIAMIFGFWQLRQLQKQQVQKPDPLWQGRFEQLCQQMGIRRPVRFLVSSSIPEPITFHFIKPVVLAPLSIFSGLTTDQIEILLLHELAHIRRQDFLVNTLQTIVEVLFFYHPAIWWLSAKIRKEREHCCDDMVLKLRNNPMLYAEALTQLHHKFYHPLQKKLVMSAKGNHSHFSKRIYRLFGQYESQPSVFKGSLIALVLLLAVLGQPFLKPSYLPDQAASALAEISKDNDQTTLQNAPAAEEAFPDQLVLENASTKAKVQEPVPAKPSTQMTVQTSDNPTQAEALALPSKDSASLVSDNPCLDLIRAIKNKDITMVRQLLKSTDPDCVYRANREIDHRDDWEPRTPLVTAARLGYLEIGKLLLEAEADVKHHGPGDETPLMAAAHYGHLDFVKLLIENSAPINTKVDGDGTALLVAAKGGHEEVVRYLIDQKAEVNAQVGGDGTPLICAVRNGHYDVAKILLENGADPFQNSPGDEYAMYHARVAGNKAMINLLKQYEDRQ